MDEKQVLGVLQQMSLLLEKLNCKVTVLEQGLLRLGVTEQELEEAYQRTWRERPGHRGDSSPELPS